MRESQAELESDFWRGYYICRAKDCGNGASARVSSPARDAASASRDDNPTIATIADAQNREAGVVVVAMRHLLKKFEAYTRPVFTLSN